MGMRARSRLWFYKTADPTNTGPSVKLTADREVYRPGDVITVTISINNKNINNNNYYFMIDKLGVEIRGIQKLDTHWFNTNHTKGEYVFMDCSAASIVSKQTVSPGDTKSYMVRTSLPSIIPPSFRGATVRYVYYVRCTLSGQYFIMENGNPGRHSKGDLTELDARIPLQIWVTQKVNGLPIEEGRNDGIVPGSTALLDLYWKEGDGDSDWTRANEIDDGIEEGYDSRDEISSVSSYNHSKGNLHRAFGSSLSLQSKSSNPESSYLKERTSISSQTPLPQLSVAEVLYDSGGDVLSPRRSPAMVSSSQHLKSMKSLPRDDDEGVPLIQEAAALPVPSESFIRGKSYNIRLDDQVLLRFSPKNSDSSYYFSDMIGGTLTFFHEEGFRRCLELSVTLEFSETINRQVVHHSRRHSPTITKVHSDHHEIVADLLQTSFLFSIPMDGPMSFSTPHVSVQWALRFEFFTTPKNVDWTKFEHPLLIEGRDKCDWVLPITVHAPPHSNTQVHPRNAKSASLQPSWSQ